MHEHIQMQWFESRGEMRIAGRRHCHADVDIVLQPAERETIRTHNRQPLEQLLGYQRAHRRCIGTRHHWHASNNGDGCERLARLHVVANE